MFSRLRSKLFGATILAILQHYKKLMKWQLQMSVSDVPVKWKTVGNKQTDMLFAIFDWNHYFYIHYCYDNAALYESVLKNFERRSSE